MVNLLLSAAVARAIDQAQLGVLERVDAEDFAPPFDPDKQARLEARLSPLLHVLSRPESGIVRVNVYGRDGTLVFGDRAEARGRRVSEDDGPLLARALHGHVEAERSHLTSPESADLKPQLDEALEVYVPLVIDGQVIGAYEAYQDLSPVRGLRIIVWVVLLSAAAGIALGAMAMLRARPHSAMPVQRARRSARASTGRAVPIGERAAVTTNPKLTAREYQVLSLLATGQTYREIAAALVVSEETVRTHVKSILHKLGQTDRTAAVVAALRLGLLKLP
jgi:DNA-binding CsgD family transcriptional regulator